MAAVVANNIHIFTLYQLRIIVYRKIKVIQRFIASGKSYLYYSPKNTAITAMV